MPASTAAAAADEQSSALDRAAAAGNGQVHVHGLRIALPEAAMEIGADGLLVGSSADAHLMVDHAEVRDRCGHCIVTVLGSMRGLTSWVPL